MSECTHDCSTCGSDCASRTAPQKDKLNEMSSVKKVIGVMVVIPVILNPQVLFMMVVIGILGIVKTSSPVVDLIFQVDM
ncbi:MAG: hypothetical protein IKV52_03410, partial [Oscillospiraceae bacterium]|nr:hypothetical protein [Oscillospiraceae bacterium]